MAEMSTEQLKGILEAKLNNTLSYLGGTLSKERQTALAYYRGDLFGNEQEGRSKVVSRDVAETIDAMMPSLMKIFVSTDQYVVFGARKPEDEQAAQQKTDYANWTFQTQEEAFNLLQTWIKDGLLNKLGVVKSYWDESTDVVTEEYEGLTGIQYKMLMADEDVEVIEASSQPSPSPVMLPGDDGQMWACKIKRTNRSGRIVIEGLPPEEFLTERRTVSLKECSFAAHRSSRTRSELIEMGFPKAKVMGLPAFGDAMENNPEKVNRFRDEDGAAYSNSSVLDPSMEKVWIAECYIKVDFNGDDVAEWRKVTVAGDGTIEILANDECDGHPFSAWSPYLSPHKLIGESAADKTMDIQLIKSTVWREMMDGLYFNTAPQLVTVEGQVNMDDVLTRRPGGVIRAEKPDAVTPLGIVDTSASCMGAISYLDSVRESRSGVRRFSAGLNGDELNPYASTATGVNKVDDSTQDTLDLIARNFAEQGLKPLFKRITELASKHQDKPQTIKLRGQWVNIDPTAWKSEMDATVTVGLGSGNKDRVTAGLMAMLTQVDAPLVQLQGGIEGPLLTAPNIYKKLNKLVESMGFKIADQFYTDPATAPPQTPKPDPKMAEVQGKLQLEQQKGQIKLQLDQRKAEQDAQIEREKAARQAQTEAAQAQADMATDRMHAENQLALERQKTAMENQREQMRLEHEMALERVRMQHELEMRRIKTHADIEANKMKAKAAAKAKPKVKA